MEHLTAIHDRGLAFDLATLNRRRALTLLGGAGLASLAACGTSTTAAPSGLSTPDSFTSEASAAAQCGDPIPEDYLRGVQEADAKGVVTFTSIFPAT
ncbi:hypothetical protein ABZ816_18910 [Actinosynnema sp. NPDC047251]|uniref:Uncharacterized protein n=1 Tax=Saccharothrix espanaensis (strain ATCC 51144 / DSM 44229 / JCM 9112 / NBRC 15066 / NRRL 15764) TaxID=1179773 RepID=K0K8U9_SACES|nr:hypothetical protein [Saccharothrix espanaensis]CCH33269.1 hypothetical protein BN6_60130 [Saccharothrix espanaensis DSM 44229]